MPDQFKSGMTDPLADVAFAASEVVVEANDLLPGLHQAINQMGANKASPSSHQVDQRPIHVYRENYHACLGSVPLQGLENRHKCFSVIKPNATLFQTAEVALNAVHPAPLRHHQAPGPSELHGGPHV